MLFVSCAIDTIYSGTHSIGTNSTVLAQVLAVQALVLTILALGV